MAARDALAPTVAELQLSAIDLYTRMTTLGGSTDPEVLRHLDYREVD